MKKFSIASFAVVALAATVAIVPSANAVDEVTIFGGFGGAQAEGFQAELDAFGTANGIKITYTTLASYDTGPRWHSEHKSRDVVCRGPGLLSSSRRQPFTPPKFFDCSNHQL